MIYFRTDTHPRHWKGKWWLCLVCCRNDVVLRMSVILLWFYFQTAEEDGQWEGMLTNPSDPLLQIVCPMEEDALPPLCLCSAPPHSEPPPPLPPFPSVTPRYSCPHSPCLSSHLVVCFFFKLPFLILALLSSTLLTKTVQIDDRRQEDQISPEHIKPETLILK